MYVVSTDNVPSQLVMSPTVPYSKLTIYSNIDSYVQQDYSYASFKLGSLLNTFRKQIPHFQLTIAHTQNAMYLEQPKGVVLRSILPKLLPETCKQLVVQLALCLEYCNSFCTFRHNNLTLDNIYIIPFETPVYIPYKTTYVKTNYILFLTDFRQSSTYVDIMTDVHQLCKLVNLPIHNDMKQLLDDFGKGLLTDHPEGLVYSKSLSVDSPLLALEIANLTTVDGIICLLDNIDSIIDEYETQPKVTQLDIHPINIQIIDTPKPTIIIPEDIKSRKRLAIRLCTVYLSNYFNELETNITSLYANCKTLIDKLVVQVYPTSVEVITEDFVKEYSDYILDVVDLHNYTSVMKELLDITLQLSTLYPENQQFIQLYNKMKYRMQRVEKVEEYIHTNFIKDKERLTKDLPYLEPLLNGKTYNYLKLLTGTI